MRSIWSPGVVRFALSGEGGLNDGIAQPFVILALGLCAHPDTSSHSVLTLGFVGMTVWGVAGALGVGALFGFATTHAVAWLRRCARACGRDGIGVCAWHIGHAAHEAL